MQNLVQALQETFEHEIPLTQHLEMRVMSYDEHGLTLKAPLAPNINHKRTAFAGSLNAVVTLAGWGLLWLVLQELEIPAKVVIQDSTCSYLRPMSNDFSAYCPKPNAAQIAKMAESLKKRGKARIELRVEVRNATTVAVAFTGRYVLLLVGEAEDQ
ncbi:MAG: YiiD C-terminal domain-containing protein [Ktedonobacteraceae bacterium]